MKFKNFYSIIAIFLLLITYSWQNIKTKKYSNPLSVIAHDVKSYYGYLPATFIDKDITLKFLYDINMKKWNYWPETAPNGGLVIKTSMGMSIMYSPFFFIAHYLVKNTKYKANGFSTPYAFALIVSSVFYVIIGFIFLRLLLLKYFKDIIVTISILILGLATNLYCYTTFYAPMSHGYSFSLFCIFLFLIEKWQEKQKIITTVFLGLIIGMITLIRPTNGLIVIVFLLFNVAYFNDILARLKFYLKNYHKIILMIFVAFIVWIPQFIYWKYITGDWFFYSYGKNEQFFFNEPKIFSVLLGFRKGWLIYTPVMLFALTGIGMLWKYNRQYFYPVLIFTVVNIYVVSSWWCWWYGGGFGMRPLIESYAILAIPLATFLAWMIKQKKLLRIPLIVVVTAISLQSIFHTIQYYGKAIHYDSMTFKAYIDSFWQTEPSSDFYSLLFDPDYEDARNGKR